MGGRGSINDDADIGGIGIGIITFLDVALFMAKFGIWFLKPIYWLLIPNPYSCP